MRNILIFYFLILFTNSFSQTHKGQIVSNVNKIQAIEFASVLNKRTGNYTFSDENGEFYISGELGDSLEIKHISYKPIQSILRASNLLELDPNFVELPEISLSNKKIPLVLDNTNVKKHSVYGIGLETIHAFKINNNVESKVISIQIPIKFKKNYSSKGRFVIQFLKNISDSISEPLSRQYTIEISQIEDSKYIKFNFDNENIILPNHDFFITIQRIVLNKEFNKNNSRSVNPFFFINKSSEKSAYYVKSIFQSKWIEMNEINNLITPALQLVLISKKLF